MLIQDAMKETTKESTEKLNYVSPTLVCFGKVGNLTQSGAGTLKETNPSGGGLDCVSDTAKRPCGSDPRAKENIVRIGAHPLGIGIYLFDYKPEFQAEWGHGRQFGVMADEVETVMPEAVCVHANGYKMVDYAMLGVQHSVH